MWLYTKTIIIIVLFNLNIDNNIFQDVTVDVQEHIHMKCFHMFHSDYFEQSSKEFAFALRFNPLQIFAPKILLCFVNHKLIIDM